MSNTEQSRVELKPCPFCGDTPELPTGDGTQYEIVCFECGHAMVSVQISDLMEIEERLSDEFINSRYNEIYIERAKIKAITLWNYRTYETEISALREEVEHYKNQLDLVCEPGLTPADAKKLKEANAEFARKNFRLEIENEQFRSIKQYLLDDYKKEYIGQGMEAWLSSAIDSFVKP